jgi:uncharacterized protein YfaS (alpha-2-macroglobulin family)
MAANKYVVGQPVKCSVTITVDGGATDPDGNIVRFKCRKPDGTLIQRNATRTGVGLYYAIVTAAENNKEGVYRYRFEGDGNGEGANELSFVSKHSEVV